MAQRTVIIGSTVGLHARPAAKFTQAVTATALPVSISTADFGPVSAASILSVMALGAKFGQEVTLEAEGENADSVLADLAALLATDLDEVS
ncbi:HPr family phosphocarrier protein [Rhodococcus sp. IEGM 1409]|uniref:HPr family phosphocarrier protein n=1 Tax=Rhodococcus sp. IEGM 1409 TaxID=3047082 RepID=UPI0024B81F5F|nr:HPr family phosphocarrier protein [Rhodococcus sp. IEGM 1409]MDI9903172.1 HPr family phosphocarrier protein [Rhodococcus sp. IEGM 1409]